MKYYTPEYIKLCDCPEIQNIVKDGWREDWKWVFDSRVEKYGEVRVVFCPNGDQLDDEIVRICRKKQIYYSVDYNFGKKDYLCNVSTGDKSDKVLRQSDNPLMAKILLLKQLLKES